MTPAELLDRAAGLMKPQDVVAAASVGTEQHRREAIRRNRRTAPLANPVLPPVLSPILTPVSLRLVWTVGLQGRLTCDVRTKSPAKSLNPRETGDTGDIDCKVTLQLPTQKILGLMSDPVPTVVAISPTVQNLDCRLAEVASLSPQQHVISLQFETGRCATIDIFQRDAQSTPLIFTDLPSVLGLRGGTYVLAHVDFQNV